FVELCEAASAFVKLTQIRESVKSWESEESEKSRLREDETHALKIYFYHISQAATYFSIAVRNRIPSLSVENVRDLIEEKVQSILQNTKILLERCTAFENHETELLRKISFFQKQLTACSMELTQLQEESAEREKISNQLIDKLRSENEELKANLNEKNTQRSQEGFSENLLAELRIIQIDVRAKQDLIRKEILYLDQIRQEQSLKETEDKVLDE
ncbi:hypothetical protein HK096_009316, partial [Nowakowskiella sp. JEL0078]